MSRGAPKQHIKTLYFPSGDGGDSSGARSRGVVAVSFSPADPEQLAVWERVSSMKAADVRAALGIRTLPELETKIVEVQRRDPEASRAEALRYLLARATRGMEAPGAQGTSRGIAGTPARTEDSLERAKLYVRELESRVKGGSRGKRAELVLIDPFAGTANFAIAAGLLGHRSYYCERSPVAAAWARLKIDMLSRSGEGRALLREQLAELEAKAALLILDQEERESALLDDPRHEPHAAAFRAIFAGDSGVLPRKVQLRAAVAARRAADDLLAADPILGRAFELAAASAAGRWARAIKRKGAETSESGAFELAGFMQGSLRDLAAVCSEEPVRADRGFEVPRFLCEDARGVDTFAPLGVNALLASLPPFSAVDVVSDAERVEAWMLRLAPEVGLGPSRGLRARQLLPTLGTRRDAAAATEGEVTGRWELSSGDVAAIIRAMKRKSVPRIGTETSYFADRLFELDDIRKLVRELERGNRRAAMALVRYVWMIATVLDAIFGWHGKSRTRFATDHGAAILEISDAWVGEERIELEPLFDAWMRSIIATPIDWDAPGLGTTVARGRGAGSEKTITTRALLLEF